MPSPFLSVSELASLFRYWQRHPLASRDLPGTVARFLRWQLGSRLLRMPVLVPWVGSTFLVIETGMTGATMNFYCGLHEAADMAFVLHALRPGDVFLDVGANVGTYTILASGVAQARTIALEPIPATFLRLLRNLRLNNLLSYVEPHCLAVGDTEGTVRFTAGRDTTNRAVSLLPSPSQEPTVEVPLTSLDHLLQATGSTPLVWKVDVEGYEPEVLRGAAAALQQPHLRAVLLEADTLALQRTMEEAGFSRFSYHLFSRTLSPASGLASSGGHNQLWIRDLPFVQERLRSAPPVRVNGLEL
jgi:FkbM family methyltransferase